MSGDDIREGLAAYQITRSGLLYHETGNPVHVWNAYRAARKLGVGIPAWVFTYFDKCADELQANPGSGKKILAAFGFATGGRRESMASEHLRWAQAVAYLRQERTGPDGPVAALSKEEAIGKVASKEGVSEKSVETAYNKFLI